MEFDVVSEDITSREVDAMVTGATTSLKPDTDAPRALKMAAGVTEIQEECDEKGPICLGKAIETGAYDLDAEYVIHGAIREPAGDVSESAVRDATTSALITADACGCESIAFPVLGKAPSSVDSPTLERRASCMLEEIREYNPTTLNTVLVADESEGIFDERTSVWDVAQRIRENYDGAESTDPYWEDKEWEDPMWRDSVLQFGLPVFIHSDDGAITKTEVLLANGVMRIDDEITVQVGDTVEYKDRDQTLRIKEELPQPDSGYIAYKVSSA